MAMLDIHKHYREGVQKHIPGEATETNTANYIGCVCNLHLILMEDVCCEKYVASFHLRCISSLCLI